MKIQLNFPFFKLVITSDDKKILNLIISQFPKFQKNTAKSVSPLKKLTIHLNYHKTKYSLIPRSQFDCFDNFPLFHSQFRHKNCIYLDAAPRSLRSIVDLENNSITSYIAVPADLEKNLLFDLTFFHPLKCLLQSYNLYILHASCVTRGSCGILFCGKSGSGKTTLALALSQKGFGYAADDKIILYQWQNGIECSPFTSRPKLKKESFMLFPKLGQKITERSLKEEKYLIDSEQFFPARKINKIRPCLLIFPRYVKTSTTRLEPVHKQAALSRLAREEFTYIKYSSQYVSKAHFFVLAGLLRQAKVYQLYYRDKDLDKIPELIDPLVKE